VWIEGTPEKVLRKSSLFSPKQIDRSRFAAKEDIHGRDHTATASLGDDVLLEILFCIRNDRATLFRCATACKRWHRLIADSSFLRRCWPTEMERYFLAGFFAQTHKRSYTIIEAGAAYFFVPSPRSAMGPGRRALASFLPSAGPSR
jgi:hypothetical protein